jgi:O-methyltransferase
MRKLLKKALRAIGYDLVRYSPNSDLFGAFADLPPEQRRAILLSKPYTMTSVSRMVALVEAVTHVTRKGIEGDIVECGVWRGGSMMVTALTLLAHGDRSRTLWLYDTYEGMSEPTDVDKSLDGVAARTHWSSKEAWCYASIEDVRANLLSTGYPEDKGRGYAHLLPAGASSCSSTRHRLVRIDETGVSSFISPP